MTVELQPDAVALAVADDLFDRICGAKTKRFTSLCDTRFSLLEDDAIDLAQALGAVMPAEPGEPEPRYMRVAFDVDAALPSPGVYILSPDDGAGDPTIYCVLAVAGHDVDLDLPGPPLQPGHALLAAWRTETFGEAEHEDL